MWITINYLVLRIITAALFFILGTPLAVYAVSSHQTLHTPQYVMSGTDERTSMV